MIGEVFQPNRTPEPGSPMERPEERMPLNFDVERDMGQGVLNGFVRYIAYDMENAKDADKERMIKEVLYLNPLMGDILRVHHAPVSEEAIATAQMAEENTFSEQAAKEKYYEDLLQIIPATDHEEEKEALARSLSFVNELGSKMIDSTKEVSGIEAATYVRNAAQYLALGGQLQTPRIFWDRVRHYAGKQPDVHSKLSYAVAAAYISRNTK